MSRSSELFQEAKKYIPGGVNSPVRAFKSVGADPVYIASGKGSKIKDVDGKEYIDCVSSWGPLILGHAHPAILEAIIKAAESGTSFGAPTEGETTLAKKIVELVPGIEKVRLVSSGTEATMSALRLARGFTGRDKVLKFEGCYHGHADSFLIKAGSGALTLGQPSSPGVPAALAADTLNAQYNDIETVEKIFEAEKDNIAAVIVEPVAGNMGVVLPEIKFLQGLRDITKSNGALLIFDEVITGFRLCAGGAQQYYEITPDLTTLGKIIGGGLPVGAFGGRADIMDNMSPQGPVYQAGTLSGNPLAVAAGLAMLNTLANENPYPYMRKLADKLFEGLEAGAKESGVPLSINKVESMGCAFFTDRPVNNFADACSSDTAFFSKFHKKMLDKGVYMAPSQYEACFVSAAHTEADIDHIINAAGESLKELV